MKRVLFLAILGLSYYACELEEVPEEKGTVGITFRVDVQNETLAGSDIHLFGEIQEIDWDENSAFKMNNTYNDVWELTIQVEVNTTYQYKFMIGQNSVLGAEVVESDCSVTEFFNRELIVGENDIVLSTVCFGECGPC